MLIWIFELIFTLIIMKFIDELGFFNSCLAFGVINVLYQLTINIAIVPIIYAFISGIILGGLAYIGAKIFLFIIDILGALGYFLVIAFFVLALIAIIF